MAEDGKPGKPVQFELTNARKEKLDEIVKREKRSAAAIVEFVVSSWLDSVQVEQFGMSAHPVYGAFLMPPTRKGKP